MLEEIKPISLRESFGMGEVNHCWYNMDHIKSFSSGARNGYQSIFQLMEKEHE